MTSQSWSCIEYSIPTVVLLLHTFDKNLDYLMSFNKTEFIKTSTVFWNLCYFQNITVSQGSAATSLRYDGICNDNFV